MLKDRAIGGYMAQDEALTLCGEDDVVLTDDITAPDRGKTDTAALASAGKTVPA